MEIFRTDGGGKSYSNERLYNLISSVEKYTNDGFFDNIASIQDHKGNLMITLKDLTDLEYTFSVFQTFWHYYNDFIVEIYFNGTIVKSSDL